jgi:hypothetical protein
MVEPIKNPVKNASRIAFLRIMIHNKEYLDQAIYRIAQVLSNEIARDTKEGVYNDK